MSQLYIHDDQGLFAQVNTEQFESIGHAAAALIQELISWFQGNSVYSDEITKSEITELTALQTRFKSGKLDPMVDGQYWLDTQGFLGTFSC
ncbi:hypothetical protein [Vibrio agarivorans]|uniref:Uncharacterized protein n=1 Tax=Vibrio agarivorans TaxID=153622 RepID=A0ABT7Y8E2_9VIBR|nr:hypothetical protein [Vibrio agarivorans]MDN2484024.1 hypothetical protein [Vibrio agarivorans]